MKPRSSSGCSPLAVRGRQSGSCGADTARKRESVARLYEARETLERSRREVAQQTRVSWNAVQSARERRVALQQPLAANERVRVAYSQQFDRGRRTLLDLIAALGAILGRELAIDQQAPRPGDVRHSQADQTRLRSLFPDVEPVAFEQGLRETVEWFRTVA